MSILYHLKPILFIHHFLTSYKTNPLMFRYVVIVQHFSLSFCFNLSLSLFLYVCFIILSFIALLFSIKCSHYNFYLPLSLSLFHPIFPRHPSTFPFIQQRTRVAHAYLQYAVVWNTLLYIFTEHSEWSGIYVSV